MADRWKNRRKMAWASLVAGLLYPILVLYTESEQLGAIAPHFYLFVGTIVFGYLGFAVWDDHLQKDKNEPST